MLASLLRFCESPLLAQLGPFVTSAIRSLWDGKRTLRRKSFQLDAGFKWRRVAVGARLAKAIQGQLAAGVSPVEIVRQAALFGARNRDGWGTGMTILTAVGNSLAILPEQETYLALFHGVRRVAIDCDGEAPARQRSSLSSRPSPATLKRWLRRWASVRHREAAERTVLTAIAIGAPPAVLADLLIAAFPKPCPSDRPR